jgi:hypothetical protein
MDECGAPAQLSFTFRSNKNMADKFVGGDSSQSKYLTQQYLEAYRDRVVTYKLDTCEALMPIEKENRSGDHLMFVKALCEAKKPKFYVQSMPEFDYDELHKIMTLVQFYILKTAVTGDPRYEEEAAYIMRFLVPVKQFTGARLPAWQGDGVGERAQQLVPGLFGN